MASNLEYILDTLKDTLGGVDGLGSVDTYPALADAWVEQIVQDSAGLPAAHISVSGQDVERYTTGDYIETTEITITVLMSALASQVGAVVPLRDSIIAAVEADQTVSGYADSVTWVDWEVESQEEMTTRFKVVFEVEHTWEA